MKSFLFSFRLRVGDRFAEKIKLEGLVELSLRKMIAPNISTPTQTEPLLLNVSNTVLHVTASEFDSLCLDNPDLRLELTKDQELIVMSPTGGESGKRNLNLSGQTWFWNKQLKLGEVFDSSTGYDFTSIGGGKMSPDVSWIEVEERSGFPTMLNRLVDSSRLDGIDLTGFIPVVPDFASQRVVGVPPIEATDEGVIELRSATDRLSTLQAKMIEYQRLGVKLGLLINPQDRQVEVSRLDYPKGLLKDTASHIASRRAPRSLTDRQPEILNSPTAIDCGWLMSDFRLDLTEIF